MYTYQSLQREKRRQQTRFYFILCATSLLFIIIFEIGLQIGLRHGRNLERQAPEYKRDKAVWMQQIIDRQQAEFQGRMEKVRREGSDESRHGNP